MKYRVLITSPARQDLLRNAEWWSQQHSAEEAKAWLAVVQKQLQELAQFPNRHQESRESANSPMVLRDQLVGSERKRSFRAIFTIQDEEVIVLRIRRSTEQRLHLLDFPSGTAL